MSGELVRFVDHALQVSASKSGTRMELRQECGAVYPVFSIQLPLSIAFGKVGSFDFLENPVFNRAYCGSWAYSPVQQVFFNDKDLEVYSLAWTTAATAFMLIDPDNQAMRVWADFHESSNARPGLILFSGLASQIKPIQTPNSTLIYPRGYFRIHPAMLAPFVERSEAYTRWRAMNGAVVRELGEPHDPK